MGGPSKKPLYPNVDTLAIAAPGVTVVSSAALLKQTGINIAYPAPIKISPKRITR